MFVGFGPLAGCVVAATIIVYLCGSIAGIACSFGYVMWKTGKRKGEERTRTTSRVSICYVQRVGGGELSIAVVMWMDLAWKSALEHGVGGWLVGWLASV